jgi:hypothetical protein
MQLHVDNGNLADRHHTTHGRSFRGSAKNVAMFKMLITMTTVMALLRSYEN